MTAATRAQRWSQSRWLRSVADLVRLAGLASLAWALVGTQWVDAALFFLVLGGLMLPRLVATTPALDLAFGATLLFAAWSAVDDLYVTYDWLDVVVHTVACGLVATLSHRWLVARSVLPPPDHRLRLAGIGVAVSIWALGLALGTLWEVGEWFGHNYLDNRIQVGYTDTIGDLMADCLGAALAGVAVARAAVGPDNAGDDHALTRVAL